MSLVGFGTAVRYKPFAQSFVKSALETADDLFGWGAKKVVVVPGCEKGASEGVVEYVETPSFYKTVCKVAAYSTLLIPVFATYSGKTTSQIGKSCLLVIPLIALVVKFILRSIYKFHYIETLPAISVGEHNAPVELKPADNSRASGGEVVRRDKKFDLLPPGDHTLSTEQFTALNIVLNSSADLYGYQQGYSTLEGYEGVVVNYKYIEGIGKWSINITPLTYVV
jgi:hypothetical protein